MQPDKLVLYADAQLASPYAMSVFVALTEKCLPFDVVTVDLSAGAHREPGFYRHLVDAARAHLAARWLCAV